MKPYPFQKECVREIEQFNGRVLCAISMGLGKTLISLWWMKRHDDAFPAVVICPASVKYHWEQEAKRVGLQSIVLEGRLPKRLSKHHLIILNYDILPHWLDRLRELKPRTIITDEVQMVSNQRAKRTKAFVKLCKGVSHVLGLSGTPLVNRPIELWTILHIIRPDVWKSRMTFAHRYCDPKWTPWGWKYQGSSHTRELHCILKALAMIRRRKADVLPDLPPKIRQAIAMPLRNPGEYRRASEDFLTWLNEIDPDKARRAAKAEAMSRMGYLKQLAARLKLRYVAEWVNQFLQDTDEKLVLFAVHKKMISALTRIIDTEPVVIDGSVTGRKRQAIVNQFQTDKKTRVLIGNIRAAGTGLTLTAASAVAFVELPWTPGALLQAEDRIHRIGTTGTAWCYYLVAKGTIEEDLCRLLQQKQKVLSAVLDGGNQVGDLDVFDRLLKVLSNREN